MSCDTLTGGVVVRPDAFGIPGRTKNLVHELGHVLGLWHVHYGVSEMSCDDACLETEPSLVLGDLCSDTAPTPENPTCKDPHPGTYKCYVSPHSHTPYNNYMSYSGRKKIIERGGGGCIPLLFRVNFIISVSATVYINVLL